jgi:hypothetical protein
VNEVACAGISGSVYTTPFCSMLVKHQFCVIDFVFLRTLHQSSSINLGEVDYLADIHWQLARLYMFMDCLMVDGVPFFRTSSFQRNVLGLFSVCFGFVLGLFWVCSAFVCMDPLPQHHRRSGWSLIQTLSTQATGAALLFYAPALLRTRRWLLGKKPLR